jgi:hypothetical protein
MMEHSSLAISPHLHISKFSFNVPEPSFGRDPTVDESSSSVSVDDEELVRISPYYGHLTLCRRLRRDLRIKSFLDISKDLKLEMSSRDTTQIRRPQNF